MCVASGIELVRYIAVHRNKRSPLETRCSFCKTGHISRGNKMGKIYESRLKRPTPNTSMGQIVLEKLRENDHVFLVDGPTGAQVTHKQLLENTIRFANYLRRRGVTVGDKIAIASENRLDWFIPAFATFCLGAILAPYNPAYTEYEFRHMLNISKPQIIFVSRRTERLLTKLLPSLSWKIELIQLDDQPFGLNVLTLKDILSNEPAVDERLLLEYKAADVGDTSRHPLVILGSSGTTGIPKGVALSHKNVLAFITKIGQPEYLALKPRDKMLLFLPLYHGYAFGTSLVCLYMNAVAVVTSGFEPKLFLSLIQEHKITHLPLVPPILTFLAKHPLVEKYDFRNVRELVCGAAPLAKDIAAEVKARLGIKAIRNGYGMTELSMVSNVSAREDDNDWEKCDVPSVGCSMPGFLTKIVDVETQETLDAGEIGEICFLGEQVMLGYWNNPEATRQTIDQDGWMHTGDVGYVDEKDRLHVVDRLKELVKYKGYQVSPSEIETVLLSHPAVKDAAVAGKPDERSGEIPIAFVVRQLGANVTAQELQEYIKQKLSPQKWLRGGVQFVDGIPKNPTGKILRRELRTMISKL